jgi:hypothetical protein
LGWRAGQIILARTLVGIPTPYGGPLGPFVRDLCTVSREDVGSGDDARWSEPLPTLLGSAQSRVSSGVRLDVAFVDILPPSQLDTA